MWNCPVALIASGTVADELHSHLTRLLGHAKPGNNDILLIPHAPTMSDLIALIQAAGLVLSGCTGPKHIAHALGVPTVCLYGRTEPHRWGAYFPTDRHTIIQSPGADLTDFELAGMPPNHVMTLITIDQVLATLSTIQPDPFPQTLPPG
jgi:ADP-heptose:LPS heptosyltransferase